MTSRDAILRAARFEHPDYVPVRVGINKACWHAYPQDVLQDLIVAHPLLFPDYHPRALPIEPSYAPWRVAGERYTDSWGCVWETVADGITGAVVEPALPTWDAFTAYVPPDPEHQNGWGTLDWDAEARRIQAAAQRGDLTRGSLRHGHTFLTLTYIRGYEAFLFDMVDGAPELPALIAQVETFNTAIVRRYAALGVDWMGFPEDLGMQRGPMLSPRQFRRYIKPSYQRMIAIARDAGCVIHMHSDGDIRALAGDLLDCGVDVLNVQDLVNGIDWLRDNLMGRVCIDLDIDRQRITRFGTPDDIRAHLHQIVATLARPEGGLMLTHDLMPGLPLPNIEALFDGLEAIIESG